MFMFLVIYLLLLIFSLYSFGDIPVLRLKKRLNEACSEKPSLSVTSWIDILRILFSKAFACRTT